MRKSKSRKLQEGNAGHRNPGESPRSTAPLTMHAAHGLSSGARQVFKQLLEDFEDAGLPVGSCDRIIVRMLANAVSDGHEACREANRLRSEDKPTRDVLQTIGRLEKLAVAHQATVMSCCDRLGLNPRSRESLTIDKPDTGMDDLMELLSRPRVKRTPVTEPKPN